MARTTTEASRSLHLLPVLEKDRKLYVLALGRLLKAVKEAKRGVDLVGCDSGILAAREAETDALLDGLKAEATELEHGIPRAWWGTLRVALSVEYDATRKLSEKEQDMFLECSETSSRLRQIEARLSELDVAIMGGEV